ncbi:MAG: hypothetical protein ACREO9_02270 [Lysobacterales bacterium]
MSAFDYAALRDAVAQPLIKDFGSAGTLYLPGPVTGPDYDPQPGADVTQYVNVVQTVFSKEDQAGGTVQKDDVAFLVSTEDVTVDPSMADRISVAGTEYQVVVVAPLRPGSVTMLWKVHARK